MYSHGRGGNMKKVIEVVPTMSTGGAEAMVKDYALLMDRENITMKWWC